jgi:hypothetical protein
MSQQIVNGMPRRRQVMLLTHHEIAIRNALLIVEGMGAHPLLTDTVVLLGQASDKLADYIENKNTKTPT